jgi:hypothetical protein
MRRLIRLSLLLLAIAAVRLSPMILRQVKAAYYFRQCLNFTAPPGQLVHENDPGKAAALVKSGKEYIWSPNSFDAAMVPEAWRNFYTAWSESGLVSDGTSFLHERQTPRGDRRLVAVDLDVTASFTHSPGFHIKVFASSGGVGAARLRTASVRNLDLWLDQTRWRMVDNPPLRFFTGQADPADLTHFTIPYILEEQRGVIDGWLKDDDTVALEVRPVTAPAPSSRASSP